MVQIGTVSHTPRYVITQILAFEIPLMKTIARTFFTDNLKEFIGPRVPQITHVSLKEQLKRIIYKLQHDKSMTKTRGQRSDGLSLHREPSSGTRGIHSKVTSSSHLSTAAATMTSS